MEWRDFALAKRYGAEYQHSCTTRNLKCPAAMTSTSFPPHFLELGAGATHRRLAIRKREGALPGLFWLGGFHSDMQGTKAVALDEWAAAQGRACVRFDDSVHGESSGDFAKGTIGQWFEDALHVFTHVCEGPQIVVGSSMGGWIALLLALALRKRAAGRAAIKALVLIAPAPDFTQTLMWDAFPDAVKHEIMDKGSWARPTDYGDDPYPITRALIEDGRKHCLLDAPIDVGCPVRILQGGQDPDVPWQHAFRLMACLPSDEVVFTLIQDGDHRLSRPQDITRILAAIAEF